MNFDAEFCEVRTYQNKMATIRSNNTKADEMKIVFNSSTEVEGKNKRLKQYGCDYSYKNDLKLCPTGPVEYENVAPNWPAGQC